MSNDKLYIVQIFELLEWMGGEDLAFDFMKLRGRIREICRTEKSFSESMGWSEHTTSLKLNSKIPWKQTEILKAINILHLSENDIPLYFFTAKVQNS